MFGKIGKIAVSAMVSLGVLAAIPVTAQAVDFQISGAVGGGSGFGVWFGNGGHSHWRRPGHGHRRGWRDGRRYNPIGRHHRCSVRRALNKARRMGVHRPRVRVANRRVIKIKGRSHGHRVRIVFSRAPGCPVIRY